MKSFLIALSTLTAFPSLVRSWNPSQLKNSVVFYPLVGAFLGSFLSAFSSIPIPKDLQALVLLLLWVVLTLAVHLDGLGDCLDGWFGGHSLRERRRIMKDSAVGVYGVTGIIFVLLSKYILLTSLLTHPDAWKWLIAIPMAARWAVVMSCFTFHPPSHDAGLGSKVLNQSFASFLISTSFLVVGLLLLLKIHFFWAVGVSVFVSSGLGLLSKNKIGGLTGDGLGTIIELSEVCLLFLSCFI